MFKKMYDQFYADDKTIFCSDFMCFPTDLFHVTHNLIYLQFYFIYQLHKKCTWVLTHIT